MAGLTPEEQRELDQLEKDVGGLSAAEAQELDELEKEFGGQSEPQAKAVGKPEERSLGGKALDIGLRGLDAAGGAVRTGVAGTSDILRLLEAGINPNKETADVQTSIREGDLERVLTGNAPSSAEFAERAGVPAGGSLSDVAPQLFNETGEGLALQRGGPLDPTARGAVGFAGDVVTDPLGAITKGGKAAAAVLRPAQSTLKGTSKLAFDAPLKSIDTQVQAASPGAGRFSALAREEGFSGNSQRLLDQNEDLITRLGQQRSEVFAQADQLDVAIDTQKALAPARAEVARLRKSQLPKNKEKAQKMDEILDSIQGQTKERLNPLTLKKEKVPVRLSLEDASNAKTEFAEQLPNTSFSQFGALKTVEKKVSKKLADGFRREIVDAGNRTAPGIGDQISEINKKFQTALAARKPLERAAKSEARINITRPVDSAFNLLAGTGTRTRGARVLESAADIPGLDSVLRRTAIDANR